MTQPKLNFLLLAFATLLLAQSCTEKPASPDEEALRSERGRLWADSIHKANRRIPSRLFATKPRHVDHYTSQALYYSSYYMPPDRYNKNRVSRTFDLNVTKMAYPNALVWIQDNLDFTDTLEIYKDSVHFNSLKAWKLGARTFTLQGKPVRIAKYYYEYHGNVGLVSSRNLFVSDSLGPVLDYIAGHHRMSLLEYDPRYKELHEAIKRDTVFLEFEFRTR